PPPSSFVHPTNDPANPSPQTPPHPPRSDQPVFVHPLPRRSSPRLNRPSRTCSPNSQRLRVSFSTSGGEGGFDTGGALPIFFLNATTLRVDSATRRANFLSRSAVLINAS